MVKIDKDVVYWLSENAKISLRELSHHLKKTPQRLKYSAFVLEKEGILKNPYCIFDYSYFGLILFRVYFKGGYISEHDKTEIIKELSDNPYITSIYGLTGEFDLGVEFACPNPSKFNKELKIIATLNSKLNDYKILLNLVTRLYPKNYLLSDERLQSLNAERIIGGDRDKENFNKNEMLVMKHLLLYPKSRLTDMAKNTKLNIKTVKSIYEGLKKRHIVKSFKCNLDTDKLGISKYRLFLKLHNISLERENQLMDYVLHKKEIVQLNKTVGDWDMELDIESLDNTKVRNIILKLREEFRDIIERFNLIEFDDYYKRSYLPMYLFNEIKD